MNRLLRLGITFNCVNDSAHTATKLPGRIDAGHLVSTYSYEVFTVSTEI